MLNSNRIGVGSQGPTRKFPNFITYQFFLIVADVSWLNVSWLTHVYRHCVARFYKLEKLKKCRLFGNSRSLHNTKYKNELIKLHGLTWPIGDHWKSMSSTQIWPVRISYVDIYRNDIFLNLNWALFFLWNLIKYKNVCSAVALCIPRYTAKPIYCVQFN